MGARARRNEARMKKSPQLQKMLARTPQDKEDKAVLKQIRTLEKSQLEEDVGNLREMFSCSTEEARRMRQRASTLQAAIDLVLQEKAAAEEKETKEASVK